MKKLLVVMLSMALAVAGVGFLVADEGAKS